MRSIRRSRSARFTAGSSRRGEAALDLARVRLSGLPQEPGIVGALGHRGQLSGPQAAAQVMRAAHSLLARKR